MAKQTRGADARSLKRKTGPRQPRKTLVDIRDTAAVDLRIETGHGGAVPRTLVGLAIAARSRAEAEEAEIDEFWCVFDVEWPRNHPELPEAIGLAKKNKIHLAITNPCFRALVDPPFQRPRSVARQRRRPEAPPSLRWIARQRP